VDERTGTVFGQLRLQLRGLQRRALLEINQPTNFGKMDLIYLISRRLNLVNYLELCTPTTGNYYGEIQRWHFNTARRLMYNCPKGFDDGLPVDFKILNFDIEDAIEKLKADPNKVDICLVDGWHTYDCAIRDLTRVYELLVDGGVLVVHDCLPPTEALASPVWIPGSWCGVVYKAFLDFVLARNDLDYCTVNLDYGCGIIMKNRAVLPFQSSDYSALTDNWFAIRNDDQNAFRFFMQNHAQLLRLIPAKAFVRRFKPRSIKRLPSSVVKGGKVAREGATS
jgi:hypothetical protein